MEDLVLNEVAKIIMKEKPPEIQLSGTGETTFRKDWIQAVKPLIRAARQANPEVKINMISNFARPLAREEFEAMLEIDTIITSIDTADQHVTREVRAKSDLNLVFSNIVRLAAVARRNGRPKPRIHVNATITNKSAGGVGDLYFQLLELPVDLLIVSDLVEIDELKKKYDIRKCLALPIDEIRRFAGELNLCIEYWKKHNALPIRIQDNFVQLLNYKLNHPDWEENQVVEVKPGQTRVCTQPWANFLIGANGGIYPCCVTALTPLGNVKAGDGDPLNSSQVTEFRNRLLSGGSRVPQFCVNCTNAPLGTIADLKQRVLAL